jgi:hypothetical protein
MQLHGYGLASESRESRAIRRMREAARIATRAESREDGATAGEAWRRYRLIRDAARDPDELLAEGVALSEQALALAALDRDAGRPSV